MTETHDNEAMTTAAAKVGDVLPWDDVPMETMVRRTWKYHAPEFYVKRRDGSARVQEDGRWVDSRRLNGNFASDETMTIAVLSLTGDETDDALNNLAEQFERRLREQITCATTAAMGG